MRWPRTSLCRFDSLKTHRKSPKRIKKGGGAMDIVTPNKTKLVEPLIEFGTFIEEGRITLVLPLRTVSEGNCFETWQKKHARHKAQKKAVALMMGPLKQKLSLPCKITCIRFAPRELDRHDNLPMSMKYLNDQVCAELTGDFRPGRADNDERLSFAYDQVKSKVYAVKIILDFGL